MLYFAFLLLTTLVSGALYGYALRHLTDPRTDSSRVLLPVVLAVPGSLLLCLSGFALLLFLKVPYTFNLGPLGGAFGAVIVADLLRFDRLFDERIKRHNTWLRCSASAWHGVVAFAVGVALFQLFLATGIFRTPAVQILLATAIGALMQALEAAVLPYFVTVSHKAERARLQRGAWRMGVLRANLLFLCSALIYASLWIPPQLLAEYETFLYASIIVGTTALSIALTSHWDRIFLTDEVVSQETINPLLQRSQPATDAASANTPALVPSADVPKAAMDTSVRIQRLGNYNP